MLDLDDDVRLEFAVEGMEVVVAGAGAISFHVAPVEMMVVDEAAVEHDAAVRLKRAGHHVGCIRGAAAILRRAGLAFGIRLMTTPPKSGMAR